MVCMTNINNHDVAEFRRLALAEGHKLTEAEAMVLATQLILLYERLAMPTPKEIRARRLVCLLRDTEFRAEVARRKRGHGRVS